jgi:CTP synthase
VAQQSTTKYIFVIGGVLSGLGKGITAASIGTILKSRGFSVNIQKLDVYFNTDAGTLNPAEHGEVFVTKDGAETDLDLGHYERFLDEELTKRSSVMNGHIYARVIANERAGKYLGKTIQIIPHVTGEIQEQIIQAAKGFDFHIVELGGTVGDIESTAALEAIRQLRRRLGADNTLYVYVVYLPYLGASHETKSKPAQNAVRDLRAAGIHPDVLIARSEQPFNGPVRAKLSLFCDVEEAGIIPVPNARSVYEVPLMIEKEGLGSFILEKLALKPVAPKLKEWEELSQLVHHPDHNTLKIGVIAKYLDNEDTYLSVFEALKSAGWANHIRPEICWIDAEKVEKDSSLLEGYTGFLVPGGFGSRGVEGKIAAATYAIKHQVPYLGLCYGLHMAVIAAARLNGLKDANTTEVNPNTPHPVINLMEHQRTVTDKGGTMRLGDYPCVIDAQSKVGKAYGETEVMERHRHRWEVNNNYRDRLQAAGLKFVGMSPDKKLVEIIELANHPFMVASQFHPEFKSRPRRPHPLFNAFMAAAKTYQAKN